MTTPTFRGPTLLIAEHTDPAARSSAGIRTLHELHATQLAIAAMARTAPAIQELPLATAGGRVLARDTVVDTQCDGREGSHVLPAGTRLEWYLLPLLAASSHGVVAVRAPLRAVVVTLQIEGNREATVGAVMVRSALERMGVQTHGLRIAEPALPESAALQRLSKSCDLILVVDSRVKTPLEGLDAPQHFEVLGRPCMVLPSCPLAALSSFVAFTVPLLRRLQGRMPELPAIRTATDAAQGDEARVGTGLCCVSVVPFGDGLRSCMPGPDTSLLLSLAGIAGVAWKPEDLAATQPSTVAFLPLAEWLR
ncbi:hypothetical protein ACFJGW_09535 [Burkholderiaceae bacterium UC74_6]